MSNEEEISMLKERVQGHGREIGEVKTGLKDITKKLDITIKDITDKLDTTIKDALNKPSWMTSNVITLLVAALVAMMAIRFK